MFECIWPINPKTRINWRKSTLANICLIDLGCFQRERSLTIPNLGFYYRISISWAEGQCVISVKRGVAGPESGSTGLVEGICICVGAVALEIAIEGNAWVHKHFSTSSQGGGKVYPPELGQVAGVLCDPEQQFAELARNIVLIFVKELCCWSGTYLGFRLD